MVPVRHLNLHEYQSKELMDQYGVSTQKFIIAKSPQEAGKAARELGKSPQEAGKAGKAARELGK